jgi:ornithine cyclodeaminase
MSVPFISFEAGEALLDWLALSDALAAGHDLPKAQIGDTFLYRGTDTLLSRAAWIDGLGQLVKTATIFPSNADAGMAPINGAVSVFSDKTGELEAIIDFHLITKWKTAADSLLAARRLAPPHAQSILIVGAGTVSSSLIAAFGTAFPDADVTIWNRSVARAEALAEATGVRVARDLERAVPEADIVLCSTMSTDPVLKGAWLRPGQHINLIGAYRPDMREADDDALRRARIYVDSLDTTLDHIGELKIPLATGTIRREDVLADFYQLDRFDATEPDEITLFKNGGGAHLDLMTATHVLDRWRAA